MKRTFHYLFLITCVSFLCSCGGDKSKMLVNTWKIDGDSSVVFQLNGDSTFTTKENDITVHGQWQLSNDGKMLVLKDSTGRSEEKRLLGIKLLSKERLVLSNNGEELNFVSSH